MNPRDKRDLGVIWSLALILGLLCWVLYQYWTRPVYGESPILVICEVNCGKDPEPSDPNRPQYDAWGNKFDATGNLIDMASCGVEDFNQEPNPYCSENIKDLPTYPDLRPPEPWGK